MGRGKGRGRGGRGGRRGGRGGRVPGGSASGTARGNQVAKAEDLAVRLISNDELKSKLHEDELAKGLLEAALQGDELPGVKLQLDSWEDVEHILRVFRDATEADPSAELVFSSTLSKWQRASIHTAAEGEGLGGLATFSRGVGSERRVSVMRAGSQPQRVLTTSQQHKAHHLWQWARESGQACSRDEVADMIIFDQVPADLVALWNLKSVQQKSVIRLCQAAYAGDVDAIKAIVVEAPDLLKERVLNLLDGAAPLQLAVKQGNAEAVQALIDAGADMEAEDGQGLTALQVARKFDQSDAEGVLLRAGARDHQANQWPGHTDEPLSSTLDPTPDPTTDPTPDPTPEPILDSTSDPITDPAADPTTYPAPDSAPNPSIAPMQGEKDRAEESPPAETEIGAAEESGNDALVDDVPEGIAAGGEPLSEDADLEVGSITAGESQSASDGAESTEADALDASPPNDEVSSVSVTLADGIPASQEEGSEESTPQPEETLDTAMHGGDGALSEAGEKAPSPDVASEQSSNLQGALDRRSFEFQKPRGVDEDIGKFYRSQIQKSDSTQVMPPSSEAASVCGGDEEEGCQTGDAMSPESVGETLTDSGNSGGAFGSEADLAILPVAMMEVSSTDSTDTGGGDSRDVLPAHASVASAATDRPPAEQTLDLARSISAASTSAGRLPTQTDPAHTRKMDASSADASPGTLDLISRQHVDLKRNVASSVEGRRHVASPEIVPMPHLDATLADNDAADEGWIPESVGSWLQWAYDNQSSIAYYAVGATTMAMTAAWLAGGTHRRR